MQILAGFFFIIIIFILGSVFLGWLFSEPAYHGPASDHFDGKKFINPGGVLPKGLKYLFKWMRERQKGEWSRAKDISPGPAPAARIGGDSIVVTFVNHSTFLIQTQGLNILTDPIWSKRASPVTFSGPERMQPPGIRFEDLPKIDMILLTHNHYDHLDIKTLKRLSVEFSPKIFTTLGVGKYLERKGIRNITEMDWWDTIPIDQELSLLCTPAQHFSGRGMFDRDSTLWAGFAIQTAKGSIYYSGDTGYGDFFTAIARKISPVRLSFLPIGAYKPEWFMAAIHTSPEDAVRIHKIIKSSKSIAMHFGTFPLGDDGKEEAVLALGNALEKENVAKEDFIALKEGKLIKFR